MYTETIEKATNYITKIVSDDVYELAIASYVLQLAGNKTKDTVLQKLLLKSNANGKKFSIH